MSGEIYAYDEALASCLEYFKGDQLAATTVIKKYLLKNKDGDLLERSPNDMHDRLASEFTRIELKLNPGLKVKEYYDIVRGALNNFNLIVPQGSPMAAIGNDYKLQSLSNCFVISSCKDSIEDIFRAGHEMAEIQKSRGGVGIDLSELRPYGTPVNNAAQFSTGVPTFADFYSHITRMIGQSARQGASMLTLSIEHPDAGLFATMKQDLVKVTGANVSLRITDAFMNAVKTDTEFTQRWPLTSNPKITKQVKAKDLWNTIIDSAQKCAEPGILNWDTYTRECPADYYPGFKSASTNPCLTGDMLLLTENGYTSLEKLWELGGNLDYRNLIGNAKLELNIINRRGVVKATHVYKTGNWTEVYEVELDNGVKIRATDHHQFILTSGPRKALSKLVLGDVVPLCQWSVETGTVDTTKPATAKIISINYMGLADTYCITEPQSNEIVINGVVIGQCSELLLSPYDSCRLISMNLYGFIENPFTSSAYFNFTKYAKYVELGQRMSDGLVELEIEAISKIIASCDPDSAQNVLWNKILLSAVKGRRTGLGTHGLADVFLSLGVKYDSAQARKLSGEIYKIHRNASYAESIKLAEERGAFPIWDKNIDAKCTFLFRLPIELQQRPRRNIANLTIAPTGSSSLMSRTSSGIEPVFQLVYDRFIKVTWADPNIKIARIDSLGDKWAKFRVIHPTVLQYLHTNNIKCPIELGYSIDTSLDEANKILKNTLPEYFVTSNEIDYMAGVELQAIITRYLDHGCSKTINMPRGSTKEQVSELYMKAWELGLKGVTVYVEGSRDGVLIGTDLNKDTSRPPSIVDIHAPKRPVELQADVHHTKVNGKDWGVVVGLMNGRPYEVFSGRGLVLPKSSTIEYATVTKQKSKKYCLKMKIKDNGIDEVADITEIYDNPEQRVITRSVCTQLRHGIPIEFIINGLKENEGSMFNYSSVLARVLKKYASKAEYLIKKCSECGSTNLALIEACPTCLDCNTSKCN